MTYAADADYPYGIGNLINDPVISNSNTPVIVTSNQFTTTCRTRIVREREDRFADAAVDRRG
jgi:hypothetical protein